MNLKTRVNKLINKKSLSTEDELFLLEYANCDNPTGVMICKHLHLSIMQSGKKLEQVIGESWQVEPDKLEKTGGY